MKKGLLGSTALIGATAMMAGAAGAAEAPTWKLTGNMNFQAYYISEDAYGTGFAGASTTTRGTFFGLYIGPGFVTTGTDTQSHKWYFGVDEAELQLNVAGTADNGLNYGFKIEINANTTDTKVADEARLQFSGGWGTIQMGDEDGAEDIMNYGGENLMGATGGFDGDQGDALIRATGSATVGVSTISGFANFQFVNQIAAPSAPTIAGDTSDATKISYFSPRFSGFQVGASLTPNPAMNGDHNGTGVFVDGTFENNIGLGANYDNSFGAVRVRLSVVYDTASSNDPNVQDISAYSVGGIVGFGPFSFGANYTDNSDSGQYKAPGISSPNVSYWDVAASYEMGPMYFSAGYFQSTLDTTPWGDSTYKHAAVTADYKVAPGLGVYAEIDFIKDELAGGNFLVPPFTAGRDLSNKATLAIVGANVSF